MLDHIFLKTIIPILYQQLYRQIEKINEKHATFSIESLWSAKNRFIQLCAILPNYAPTSRCSPDVATSCPLHVHNAQITACSHPVVHWMCTFGRPPVAHFPMQLRVAPGCPPGASSGPLDVQVACVHGIHSQTYWLCSSTRPMARY